MSTHHSSEIEVLLVALNPMPLGEGCPREIEIAVSAMDCITRWLRDPAVMGGGDAVIHTAKLIDQLSCVVQHALWHGDNSLGKSLVNKRIRYYL